jgi:hypothetical protein
VLKFLSALMAAALSAISFPVQAEDTAAPSASFPPYKHPVMTWVPPYSIAKCKARLNESFDGVAMADGLTHLGLQFWTPTPAGGVAYAGKQDGPSDAVVSEFVQWGHAHGVRVLLCVYNGSHGWDWNLARAAFTEHRDAFVEALINEVTRLHLDGVDIDLEGNGSFEKDKGPFLDFMRPLSAKLHAQGRHLTVDTFSHIWNAPNQQWWPELLPLVDGLTTMGYEEIGANAPEWKSYAAQKAATGEHAAKFMLGMPAHKDAWHGNTAAEQLKWVVDDGGTGVSMWDAQLNGAWSKSEIWKSLGQIRGR